MPLSSREELKTYCLRRLGFPVIEINIDDDQLEDRVQDAIDYYQEYHFDGVEKVYLKSQVTASIITLTDESGNSFIRGEKLVGSISGATAEVHLTSPDTIQLSTGTSAAFVANDIITGDQSGHSATVSAFTWGNWDEQYFDVSDSVLGIVRVFPIGPTGIGSPSRNIFDVAYQFRLTDLYDLLSTDLIYYSQVKQHMQLLEMILPGLRSLRFNRKSNRLYIDTNWKEVFKPGDFIVAEVYRILDPQEFTKIYNDMFLKKYTTALIKRQWGINMKKFEGIQLPGGVTLNGQKIYDEAVEEISQIENEMLSRYSLPVDMMIG
jgi:hypothetical protein